MSATRLFISQAALDGWIAEDRAKLDGEEMHDKKNNQKWRLNTGVRFLSEVTGEADASNLVGKVKDVDQLAELKAEHMNDSVILGDNAYSVQEGFVGTLVEERPANSPRPRPRAATIASLQAFFLNNVK